MDTGKAHVLGAIAKKKDAPFKARDIVDASGLSRQLVHYHLNRMIELGWVIKEGHSYLVTNLENIIEEMLGETRKVSGPPESGGFISPETAKVLNKMTQDMILSRIGKFPEYIELSVFWNNKIDESLAYFKTLKRFLNNSEPSIKQAKRRFENPTSQEFYERVKQLGFRWSYTQDQWVDAILDRVDEIKAETENE